nr:hypothetical protein [Tanacetum cinerariifolium]
AIKNSLTDEWKKRWLLMRRPVMQMHSRQKTKSKMAMTTMMEMGKMEMVKMEMVEMEIQNRMIEVLGLLTITNTRSGMTPATIEEMINRRVTESLEAQEINRNLDLENLNDNHNNGNGGNGNGNGNGGNGNRGNGNDPRKGGSGGEVH